MLQGEVARMQTLHPERTGELARGTAMIVHGQVLPSPDDPATGQVLSSDLHTTYSVNGTCSCQAGQHGRDCKHQHAWKLYRYIQGKVEGQAPPVQDYSGNLETPPLPEAPASVNCHLTIAGRQVQLTLRDTNEERLLQRLQTALAQYPAPQPQAGPTLAGEGICPIHQVQMRQTTKEGRTWWSHRTAEGWCKGKVRR
jgi:hypothetical protein